MVNFKKNCLINHTPHIFAIMVVVVVVVVLWWWWWWYCGGGGGGIGNILGITCWSPVLDQVDYLCAYTSSTRDDHTVLSPNTYQACSWRKQVSRHRLH